MGSSERDVEIRRGFSKASTHLLLVLVLFLLPDIIWSMKGVARHIPQYLVYLKGLLYILVFYLNLLLIAPKTIGVAGHQWRFIVYNVGVLLIALAICWVLWDIGQKAIHEHFAMIHAAQNADAAQNAAANVPANGNQGNTESMFRHPRLLKSLPYLTRDAVMIVLSIGLSVAMFFSQQWESLERKQRKLKALQKEEEIKNLRAQIHPHFLFNTLNTIYALIDVAPERAQEAVHTLSRFLRHILDSPQWCTVESEMEFIQNYLALMQLRMPSNRKIDITLDQENNGARHIPSLMLITVIENVFKHGDVSKPIEISIVAGQNGVSCHTKNYIEKAPAPACQSKYEADTKAAENGPSEEVTQKSSIGLQNLQRRLDLTYDDKAKLDIVKDAETYCVDLEIPYIKAD